MAVRDRDLTQLSSGLDALDVPLEKPVSRGRKIWRAAWPKLLAIAIVFGFWQFLVWIEWKPSFALPSPKETFESLYNNWDVIFPAARRTLGRAVQGFAIALLIGTVVGSLVARVSVLRAAVGSMITGLQTMPSVAWFPAALLLFKQSEGAILFVVVLGAAPSIANGLINGIDNIPPVLLRAGRVLGASKLAAYRHVVLPAALPAFVGGLKQGWAFAWRSLLAGELLVLIAGKFSLGQQLAANQEFGDAPGLYATMIVIFVIGVIMDACVFGVADRWVRRRYGLIDTATAA
jgi:NitT/TauT family transport system permease protein